ncbi:MAG: hypothetical protein KC613_23215, partial [Myxococcales bacterium]|nr:hypothetical protein [Myxococcales bacterium]
MNRRVLMITTQWPPVPTVGTRRPVRLARHLPAHGWTPVVMVDDPPDSAVAVHRPPDHSLIPPDCEVHRVPGRMPGAWAHRQLVRAVDRAAGARAGWIAHRLATGLALPDHVPEWTPTVVRAARRIPPVDAVWTTGRPFGMFVVAAAVARALGKPLVLD